VRIWKFPLKVTDVQDIRMPQGANILCVQAQFDSPCIWALCDENAPTKNRTIYIYGTGHEVLEKHVHDCSETYIGTFQLFGGTAVFHVFEAGE
jgi:hypothetical protein